VPVEPRKIGSFEIVDELGQGGMAVVYRARQPSMGRLVALKEMTFGARGNPGFAERFLREARIGGSLAHPNIVVVYDYFEAEGGAYIAMEYVEGGSLAPMRTSLTVPQALGVLESLLSALAHADDVGIVHRDLKPANLLITRDGRIKVADFGIAKAYDTTTQLGLTATGSALGTPAYMAPEQAMGGDLDARTDLYAAGLLAYELFAGRPPFDPQLPWHSLLYKHVNERPPSPSSVNPEISPSLSEWIEQLLAKAPDDRPPDATTAWSVLDDIAFDQLGRHWRREARLPVSATHERSRPLTPAPFVHEAAAPPAPVEPAEPPVEPEPEEPAGDEYQTFVGTPPVTPREMTTGELEVSLGGADSPAPPVAEPAAQAAVAPTTAAAAAAQPDQRVPRFDTELVRVTHDALVERVVFDPDGALIATAGQDKAVSIWDAQSGHAHSRFRVKSWARDVAFSAHSRRIAAGGLGEARVWDRTGKLLARLPHDGWVRAVAFGPNGIDVATASENAVRVWDTERGRERFTVLHDDLVNGIAFNPRDHRLVTVADDRTARLWMYNGEEVSRLGHDDAVHAAAWSADGEWLATASADQTARVWAGGDLAERARMLLDDEVYDVAVSPVGPWIATASADKTVRVWDATDGRELARIVLDDPACAVDFSPDGRRLAMAYGGTRKAHTTGRWSARRAGAQDAPYGCAAVWGG
jgi:predicted Ser/Thr protein kinase